MMRPVDAKKTASTLALFGLAGIAAAAAIWYFDAPARAPSASAPTLAATASAASLLPAARPGPVPAPTSLPVSLMGTTPPRLPLDARGHLRKSRGVREFFDYFLTAQHEMPHQALDALVRKQIAAQLDDTMAEPEALDLWQRYQAYLEAMNNLKAIAAPPSTGSTASTSDLDAMQSSLDERAAVAARTLGADWNEAFFGADWRRAHYMIERWRVLRDASLTEAQKAARLQALEQSLPPGERTALEKSRDAQARIQAVAQLRQQGMTLDQLRAKATQEFGPQAAERIVKMQQNDEAWHAKYADYSAQRARIDAMGLSPTEREAQIEQLRQRVFTDPSQALRAASLDHGAGR
ncbi:lipase secretion chaperone [Trinickia diaoshuihuensis]|jgi:lipase chaperone LimK|uniref:lipase secretion chaperone n=1 Tax=Trinickia diaoshuihuensis TaxID=2292265 RepID=UPI001F07BF3A|nr:lipase secretion chaperone [Trinickia diaoshuihuensis]